jgi:peptidoglycan/LPS O-acetylase OafA/YrhL
LRRISSWQHLNQFETRYASGPIPFLQYGDIGADLFFVLSGFVMVAVAGRHVGPLQFLWRRATRIYPTYWLASLITLGIAAAFAGLVHQSFEQVSTWRSFLLIGDETPPVIFSGWTLVHEMYFYVIFAVILAFRAPPLAGAHEHRASSRPPAFLVAIGDWSYSIYLFHFMVLSAVARAVLLVFPDRGALESLILFIIGFAACNIAGAAVYFLFERPTLQMFRKTYIVTAALRRLGNAASRSASFGT